MRWASVSVCVVLLWVNHGAHGSKEIDWNECCGPGGPDFMCGPGLMCWERRCQCQPIHPYWDVGAQACKDKVGWNQHCGQGGPLCGPGLKCLQNRCQCTDPGTPYWDEGAQACKDTPPPGYVAYYDQQCAAPPTGPACSHTMTCEHKGTKSVCKCSENGHIYNTVAEMCIPRLGLDLGGECHVLGRGDVPCKYKELYCRARFCQCKKWEMNTLIFNRGDGHQSHLYLNERDRDVPEKCKDDRGVACMHVDLNSRYFDDVRLREYHIGYKAKQIISLARHNRDDEGDYTERSEGQKACKRNETFGWNCTVTLWVSGGCSDVFTVCYIMGKSNETCDETANATLNATGNEKSNDTTTARTNKLEPYEDQAGDASHVTVTWGNVTVLTAAWITWLVCFI